MGIGAYTLWYNHPATEWTEALPLGNGSLGAMVFGDVDKETVGLNLDTLWSGYSHYYKVENKVEKFKKARELALNGQKLEARNFIADNLTGDDCEWFLQLGKIHITSMKHLCPKTYRRSLDISKAVSNVEFTANDIKYTREAFISCPGKVFVYKYTSEQKNLDLKFMIDCELRHEVFTDNDTYKIVGIAPSHLECDDKANPIFTYLDGEKEGIRFCTEVRVVSDGKIKANANHLHITDASEVIFYLSAENNFESFDKLTCNSQVNYEEICHERIENAVKLGYDRLLSEHIADYKKYYDRVSVDFGNSKKDNVPTDRRLHEFLHNKNNDNDLYCLLFNYGRYLTISGSREGSQAMTLQGIWTFKTCSPWRSNYTVNINTEMNYWPTMMCSLPEMTKPLMSFIKDLSKSGIETAKNYYGADGFCCHHNVDLWRISTPSGGNPVWSFWSLAGAWFCRHLFEEYEYTLNKDFLRKDALPIMAESCKFCLDMLVEDKDGYLIFAPSTSPENEFKVGKEDCSVSQTTYMTMEIVRDLFENTIKAYAVLGESNELCEKIKSALGKLLPFKISKTGGLYEWYEDEKGFDKHHRHVSHLYALHPANIIDIERTPDLAEAAKRTLEIRGDHGTGWSLGWKINFWARLRDKDKVIKLIDNQLRYIKPKYRPGRGGTFPNMFDAHPPFQIDGNFGATCGIAQALMQSFDNKIIILPALPDKWADGYIHGLTAKGNVRVDIDWQNCKLTQLVLDGNGTFEINYNGKAVTIELDGKKDVTQYVC